ncbi:hypothetical protein L6452_44691 [Arctium lappa]|uniref:Uncharacterized protein n=1 Tax=Arctium lappa TaxID=4217 RepID=A0ACB8XH40_ARCLA|nr:hypothetical protein L6452_44691 [Arctium lappa]
MYILLIEVNIHDFAICTYCVVAKESVVKQISIAFLECVRANFKKRYGSGKADTTVAKSLNKDFGPIMKEHMQYIIEHADEIEKLVKVKAQVSEVKSIMLDNIDKRRRLIYIVDRQRNAATKKLIYKNGITKVSHATRHYKVPTF